VHAFAVGDEVFPEVEAQLALGGEVDSNRKAVLGMRLLSTCSGLRSV
jgi:hypothetical protein